MQDELNSLKLQLSSTKSRAFDVISGLTAERDAHAKNSHDKQEFINYVAKLLELDAPTADDVYQKVTYLMSLVPKLKAIKEKK